jgi:hypothetical protein
MRHWILFALVLPLPSGVTAQPTATGGPPSPVIMQFVRFADIFGSRLVSAFDSIPATQYGYRPTPAQQTVGYIAQHLEDANYSLCERLGTVKRAATASDSLADTVKARWPKDTLVVRLRASLTFCDDALLRLKELNSPAVAATLLAFETDLAEHYAQIASYMRMLGLTPPSALPARRRSAMALPVATLSQYAGTYEITRGWELVVAMRDSGLTVRSSMGGPAVPLQPESETLFFVSEADAELTFARDSAGSVTGLVLYQYGRRREAKKIR